MRVRFLAHGYHGILWGVSISRLTKYEAIIVYTVWHISAFFYETQLRPLQSWPLQCSLNLCSCIQVLPFRSVGSWSTLHQRGDWYKRFVVSLICKYNLTNLTNDGSFKRLDNNLCFMILCILSKYWYGFYRVMLHLLFCSTNERRISLDVDLSYRLLGAIDVYWIM